MQEIQKDKVQILQDKNIKKEIRKLNKMFEEIEDENKKTLVKSLIEEASFLKIALIQAKEDLKQEGLTTTTTNASQKFVKAHPSCKIYSDYSKQYTSIIKELIEYLPEQKKKTVSKLAALRDE